MIGKRLTARHAVVVASIGATTALAGFGVIGGGSLPERFDAKTVVIAREGDDSVRITEHVDIDFGSHDRRGYERVIPNDFGVAQDVTASTPDADGSLSVVDLGSETRIRIGDPNITFTGQHRYRLSYTLPDPRFDELGLAVDVVEPGGDNETGRFEVVVTGFELGDTRCDVGGFGDRGGCRLTRQDDGTYRVVLEPLHESDGLTVVGSITGFVDVVEIDEPPIPERRGDGPNRGLVALGFAGLGTAGAVPVFRWARRRGSNEVYSGGAVDAAYGGLPPPGSDRTAGPPVTLVADDDMGDLATTEFAPPRGIDPWEAQVLLTEDCGNDAVEAWLSGLVGKEALDIEEQGKHLSLSSGPKRAELAGADAGLLDAILEISDPYVTGEYDSSFATAWSAVHSHQVDQIDKSGWWKHMSPGKGLDLGSGSPFAIAMLIVFIVIWAGWTVSAFVGLFASWLVAIAAGLIFPAVVAYFVYRALLPARSAQGSALALQAESFRRFLHASEAQHVEWAWSKGLLREYSAWAVALGEADAWSRALDRANVPAPAHAAAGPIIIHHHASSMRSTRTAPSSSGGGGGGFGGGGVGGGGGGGSSGSW
jgi:uncharacterized membrane protein YgcG